MLLSLAKRFLNGIPNLETAIASVPMPLQSDPMVIGLLLLGITSVKELLMIFWCQIQMISKDFKTQVGWHWHWHWQKVWWFKKISKLRLADTGTDTGKSLMIARFQSLGWLTLTLTDADWHKIKRAGFSFWPPHSSDHSCFKNLSTT